MNATSITMRSDAQLQSGAHAQSRKMPYHEHTGAPDPEANGAINSSGANNSGMVTPRKTGGLVANLLMLSAIAALGLLSHSVYQASFVTGLERMYALLATGTTGLLALHHSLRR